MRLGLKKRDFSVSLMSSKDSVNSQKRTMLDRKPIDLRRKLAKSVTQRKMLAKGRWKRNNAFIKSA